MKQFTETSGSASRNTAYRRPRMAAGVGLLLALAISCLIGLVWIGSGWWSSVTEDWSESLINQTTDRGNSIMDAVRSYRFDNGSFPDSLDHLTPAYLDEIPPPLVGSGRWDTDRRQRSDGAPYFTLTVYSDVHHQSFVGALLNPEFLKLESDVDGWWLSDPMSGG